MYSTGEAIAFFFVFLSQVLLISWFFPRRILSGIRYVQHNFPPATHPKMYPQPVERYQRVARNFARLNFAAVVAGLLILAGLVLGTFGTEWDGAIVTPISSSGEWDAAIVTPFFIVQFIPFVYLVIASREHYRAMAKAAPPRVRTTELRRRRFVDVVSPPMLALAALIYVGFVTFILWYNRFGFAWFTAFWNIVIVTAMYLALGASVAVAVYGRRPDHYQAHEDRANLIKLVATRALALNLALPVLTVTNLLIKLFDPASSCTDRVCPDEFLEPVIASLWVQAGAALALSFFNVPYEKTNFDVYKQDAGDSRADASRTIGSTHPSRS